MEMEDWIIMSIGNAHEHDSALFTAALPRVFLIFCVFVRVHFHSHGHAIAHAMRCTQLSLHLGPSLHRLSPDLPSGTYHLVGG